MVTKFIVYGIPRTGSNFFISQLNAHPQILCHYEIFHPEKIYYGFSDKQINYDNFKKSWDMKKRDNTPDLFLNDLFQIHQREEVIGYNIFPSHNNYILKNSLMDKNQKKIVLKRKNILKTFISREIALKTKSWSSVSQDKSGKNIEKKIYFEEDELLSYLLRTFNYYNYIETLLGVTQQNYLVIYYEDLIGERDYTLNKVFDFLGVQKKKIDNKSKFVKQNPEGLDALIENYQYLNQFISEYDFYNFLIGGYRFQSYRLSMKKKLRKFIYSLKGNK
jgi:LPS sulfotransferase NodH